MDEELCQVCGKQQSRPANDSSGWAVMSTGSGLCCRRLIISYKHCGETNTRHLFNQKGAAAILQACDLSLLNKASTLSLLLIYFSGRSSFFLLASFIFRSCLVSRLQGRKKIPPRTPIPVFFFLSFLAAPPSSSRLNLFKVQLARRTHVHGIKDSVETIKRFGMWKCSEGATVCICVAPERLPRSGGASGKGSRQSDGTTGH